MYSKRTLAKYSPDRQIVYCANIKDCLFGDHPTLAELSRNGGRESAVAWVCGQILNLSKYSGSKTNIDPSNAKECACIITQEYWYLKVTELMLFFYMFKAGKWKFYGAVSALEITSALRKFIIYRQDRLAECESEMTRKCLEESRTGCVSHEEARKTREYMEAYKKAMERNKQLTKKNTKGIEQ